ncbi:choline kinase family protein [Roseibium aggregatum]|uniref:Phosphotransferase n=1 Tax=Roseibium aggregatum TaxID=187304 RepID=A0A939ELB3_9HYPH|nr:choline kinase family protein [Roseibium aggregatum]MBN9673884.1 phosphotransferase [Roseibium aggregatum]
MTPLDQAIAKARILPCWQELTDVAPLEGGITNVNLVATDRRGKYVVRFGEDIVEHGVMRFNELAISRAAADARISPRVHHAEDGILVLDYVESVALKEDDLHDQQTLLDVTDLIRKAHVEVTLQTRGPVLTFWVFHVLRDYAAFLKARNSVHVSKLPLLMEQAGLLEKAVGKVDLLLGHNDLLPANILRSGDRFWLVDWEYGGYNSPLFDLGGLATNCGLPPEAEHLMLRRYFGADPDAALMRSYDAMKCGSLLRETMWSMVSEITSDIDFDYAAYTNANLGKYRQAFDRL